MKIILTSFKFTLIVLILAVTALCVCLGRVYAEEIDLDRLIPVLIQVESSGRPNAYNKKTGAIGLMQITPIVLKDFERKKRYRLSRYQFNNLGELYRPEYNVYVGTWYLNYILSHYLPFYGLDITLDNLLISWFAGPEHCFKYRVGKVGIGPKTRAFIKKVTKLYRRAK